MSDQLSCPLCADMPARLEPGYLDRYGHTIATSASSVLRLCTDQFSPGYSALICRQHVVEPYQLDPQSQSAFFTDVCRAGQAIAAAVGADKMNYLMLGNEQPHLHCHLIPRFDGDPAHGRPYLPAEPVTVEPDELRDRAARIRALL